MGGGTERRGKEGRKKKQKEGGTAVVADSNYNTYELRSLEKERERENVSMKPLEETNTTKEERKR